MDEFTEKAIIAAGGLVIGFAFNWLLAERKSWAEMRKAIAEARVDSYKTLWPLCKKEVEDRSKRAAELHDWYETGGGLYLSFDAMTRFHSVRRLLEKSSPTDHDHQRLGEDLSWLRTEMKVSVGTYSRSEAQSRLTG